MTRRLLAVASLTAVFGGLAAVVAVPASAGTYICIGTTDRRTPGYVDGVCIGNK